LSGAALDELGDLYAKTIQVDFGSAEGFGVGNLEIGPPQVEEALQFSTFPLLRQTASHTEPPKDQK
jgi:hypothetical protein